MEYTYLLEENTNKNISFDDIIHQNCSKILYILCYHIETEYKYPFLQFMMVKVPYCNNIVKEQLILPYIICNDTSGMDIQRIVLHNIKHSLDILGCDHTRITEDMYKGVLFGQDGITSYALVNITGIDIYGINLMRQTTSWFVLPSEIINTKKVCNINIDSDVTYLFTEVPQLGLLVNTHTNKYYMLPDAVYTGNEIKQVEFNSIFGNRKTKTYESCGEYYFFYRSFGDAVNDGGWLKNGNNKIGERIIFETNSNKYIVGGINRYALFMEGKIYLEVNKEFSLKDEVIKNLYQEPCIVIYYSGERDIKPDVLVKNYESFVCLSYHKLNNSLLDEYYLESNKNQYMIS
jgi:hypothetical protein